MSQHQPQPSLAGTSNPDPIASHGAGSEAANVVAASQMPVSPWDSLPPGWDTVVSPADGRIYYWERSTGLTSWAHPMANLAAVAQQPQGNYVAGGIAVAPDPPQQGAAGPNNRTQLPTHPPPPPPPPYVPQLNHQHQHQHMMDVPAVIATPGAPYYSPDETPPSTPQPHQQQQLQDASSKDEALLPPQVPRTMRTGGRHPHGHNPFQGWGQFFAGGYQSSIPSSPSTASSNGSYCGYGQTAAGRNYPINDWHDTPQNASHRPSSHQCHAMFAFILFPPLGVCAFINAFQVDKAWAQGQYGEAYNYSKQAKSYATFACWIGVLLWTYILVIQPNENFNFGQWWQQVFGG